MNSSRKSSSIRRLGPLILILVALFIVSMYVPYPGSWPVHCFFTFTLTLLIYKNLLKSGHTKAFLCAMIFLMVIWEIFEWIVGLGVPGHMFRAVLDTTMDLIAGLLGTIIGIWRSQLSKVD